MFTYHLPKGIFFMFFRNFRNRWILINVWMIFSLGHAAGVREIPP